MMTNWKMVRLGRRLQEGDIRVGMHGAMFEAITGKRCGRETDTTVGQETMELQTAVWKEEMKEGEIDKADDGDKAEDANARGHPESQDASVSDLKPAAKKISATADDKSCYNLLQAT
jgi:hypothetical protein